jgi:hypothetical protein
MLDRCTAIWVRSNSGSLRIKRRAPTYRTVKAAQEPTITAGEPTVRAMTEGGLLEDVYAMRPLMINSRGIYERREGTGVTRWPPCAASEPGWAFVYKSDTTYETENVTRDFGTKHLSRRANPEEKKIGIWLGNSRAMTSIWSQRYPALPTDVPFVLLLLYSARA